MSDSDAPPLNPAPNAAARQSWLSRSGSRLVRLVQLAVVSGVLLHLTLRDAIPGIAVLYYALPRIVLAALALLVALATAWSRRTGPTVAWLVIAAVLIAWWHRAEWREAGNDSSTGITVMYWNTGRGAGGWEAIMAEIEDRQPDLVALGETDHPSNEFRTLWCERFPQYDVSFLGGGMLCLVRGASSDARVPRFDDHTQGRELDVTIDGAELRCLIIDVYALPVYDRSDALSAIAQHVRHADGRPLLILGDFNTPVESIHLRDLRKEHVNAFEQAGQGYIATWPARAPMLSLDQIWANSQVAVLNCRHLRTAVSDHCAVEATVRIRNGKPALPESGN